MKNLLSLWIAFTLVAVAQCPLGYDRIDAMPMRREEMKRKGR